MCIRDRVDVGAAVRVLQMVGVGIGAEICRRKGLQSIAASVSYTHLDVYKRQPLPCFSFA